MTEIMRDQIAGWVEELGFGLADLPLDETAWAWGAAVTSDDGKAPVFVGQLTDDLRQVIVLAPVHASEEHLTAFRKLAVKARKEFVTDLRLQLSDLPVDTSFHIEDADPEPQMTFHVGTRLLDEDITRAKLYEASMRVRRTCTKIRLILDKLVPGV